MYNLVDLPRAERQKDAVNAMHVYKEATEAIMFINNKLQKEKNGKQNKTEAPESVIPVNRPRPRS